MLINRQYTRQATPRGARLLQFMAAAIAVVVAAGCSGPPPNLIGPSYDDDENTRVPGLGFALAGMVMSAETGDPLEGAIIQVVGADGIREAETDGEGEYRIEGLDGPVTVTATAHGYAESEEFSLRMAANLVIDFELGAEDTEVDHPVAVTEKGS